MKFQKQRPTKTHKMKRIEYIDFAKGFAILSIVIFHYCRAHVDGFLSQAIELGGTGVHLFFMLSGFSLGLSSQNIKPLLFYKRRLIKIILPYYIFIFSVYIINLFCSIYPDDGIYALGGHLFFYKMFDKNIIGSFGYHLWFISTILQFYFVFPFLIRFKNKIGKKLFIFASFLVSFSYWLFLVAMNIEDLLVFRSFFLQYLWEFGLVIVLSDIFIQKPFEFKKFRFFTLSIFSVICFSIMGLLSVKMGRIGMTFNDVPAAIGYVSLSLFFYKATHLKWMKPIKLLFVKIGYISYELYLIHGLVLVLFNTFLLKTFSISPNIFGNLVLVLPITLFMSYFFVNFKKTILYRAG